MITQEQVIDAIRQEAVDERRSSRMVAVLIVRLMAVLLVLIALGILFYV